MHTLMKQGTGWLTLTIFLGLFLTVEGGLIQADPLPLPPSRADAVAIDPGHGGRDDGARGPTGLLEKTITLSMARQLVIELETEFQVTLTRSDDYHVDLYERTAIANHAKANLMVSLHTGAGFRHVFRGRMIYYHAGRADEAESDNARTQSTQNGWHQVQSRHLQASKTLAETIKRHLDALADGESCHIQAAPLVVLQGADMPAVLVEIGHITHPETEKTISQTEGMTLLVNTISQGIREFLK